MPPKITRVRWSAQSIPWGMAFDEHTGTFSGTPDDEGTYTVPVHVETNYGEDTKDVTISVDMQISSGKVYALGVKSEEWSNNAEPDDYGFRQLEMPNATKLTSIFGGFAAKTADGNWYIASSYPTPIYHDKVTGYGDEDRNFNAPRQYLGDQEAGKIIDIVGGNVVGTGLISNLGERSDSQNALALLDVNNNAYIYSYKINGEDGTFTSRRHVDKATLLQEDFLSGLTFLKQDKQLVSYIPIVSTINLDENATGNVIKIASHRRDTGGCMGFVYLTSTGELWGTSPSNSSYRIAEEVGVIRNFWLLFNMDPNCILGYISQLLVLTHDNKLYARGNNLQYCLGLPEDKSYDEFTEVGEFNIKKISYPFILTKDGKLYHVGTFSPTYSYYGVSGVEQHQEITHIFPEYRFQDIALAPCSGDTNGSTLVVTRS